MAEFLDVLIKSNKICRIHEHCEECPLNEFSSCFTELTSKVEELLMYEDIVMNYDSTDWSKVPVDTKILVKHNDKDSWKKRHFAKYENGSVYAFYGGETSWSHSGTPSRWEVAKLYEEGAENKY